LVFDHVVRRYCATGHGLDFLDQQWVTLIAQRAGIAHLSSSLENTDWHFDSESIMLEFLSELMNLKLETQRLKSPVDKWLPPRAVLPSGSLIPPWPLGYHMLRKLDQDCGSKQNGWLGRTRRGGYLAGEHAIGQEAMTAMGGGELAADFVSGPVGYRFRRGAARSHPLARAAGFVRGNTPSVVDATPGLGRDAFLLASLGARVTMVERSAAVHRLLEQGLAQAKAAGPAIAAVVARMTLIRGDARDHLPSLRPEVVIVDPMHPPRKNTASVKKEMILLRELVGTDADALELMRTALAFARNRVVLKWPLRADPLQGLRAPSHQFIGKTVRYDVFVSGGRGSAAGKDAAPGRSSANS
jgi:16S rRNA (guanine1516-N2)-methyltransferase